MQQKIIQVGNKKLLVLDMPEDAITAHIDMCELFYKTRLSIDHWAYSSKNMIRVVGFKTDLTESQWAEIVESAIHRVDVPQRHAGFHDSVVYLNYKHPYSSNPHECFCLTSALSGLSLLQANDCDWNNALIIEIL